MNEPDAQSRARIEHLGITVPDIAAATEFFEQVFGADVMWEMVTAEAMEDPAVRAVLENFDLAPALGVPPGTKIKAIRLLMIGESLMVELFEWEVDEEQRPPVVPTDFGLQHACIHVDDIHVTAERFEQAGGTLFDGPVPLFGPPHYEGGLGRYTRTPWGTTIELMSYPSAPPPPRS
jgi:catechol 2,3-dioxygenase-like lactoylglutathione lyase family enzyme